MGFAGSLLPRTEEMIRTRNTFGVMARNATTGIASVEEIKPPRMAKDVRPFNDSALPNFSGSLTSS